MISCKDDDADTIAKLIQPSEISSSNTDVHTCDKTLPLNVPEQYRTRYLEYLQTVQELEVPILQSIQNDAVQNFKYYYERYFENQYSINIGVDSYPNDMLVRVHTNRTILIAPACSHAMCNSEKKITDINFIVNKSDRSNIKTKGVRKHGARAVDATTIICKVTLEGEEKPYNIRAGVTGYLVEINELIKRDPQLLKTEPKKLGFLAVILPKGRTYQFEDIVKSWNLLSEEQYIKHLSADSVKMTE
ncbi:unnamed protein product [Acanthoscelides obtectus]|uniref:Protein Abitram n=1 Tax=Acanthoscelides obtectus TaxID=200917 RepID=A0A9P0K3A8_ACAOB|nr:unnamed protein product [Acanthoscelides obtectus]CAK1634203.1 Protein Simiate [Acanthoscelides obtectus]